MKDMHKRHYFLGIEAIRTLVRIMIFQWHEILNLLYKFGVTEWKFVSTPLDQNLKLDANLRIEEYEPT